MSALPEDGPDFMTIGEVLSELSVEFPDISISKIRFLEGEGLIAPERAPSGYRRFAQQDVDQLRIILRAQRDRYLPLRVIKEQLASGMLRIPVPEETEPKASPEVEGSPGTLDIDPKQSFTRRELTSLSGLSAEVVDDLVSWSVIEPDPSGRFIGADVLVCRAFAVLAPRGIESRHMRQVKTAASRDVGLVGSAVSHLGADDRLAAEGEMVDALTEAHFWLVMAGLNRSASTPGHRPRRSSR